MANQKTPEDETSLTRDELFELVWKEPMKRLAPRFGVSDVGLAKMCRRLNIPTPPRGYWAKLQHGKKVKQPSLPPAPPQTAERISVKSEAHTPGPDDNLPQDITALISTLRQRDITVPKTSSKTHSAIARWQSEDEAKKYSLYSTSTKIDATERRRRRILNTLFREIERVRGSIKADTRHGFKLTIADEVLEVVCRERFRQVKVPLTPEERRRSWNESQEYRTDHQATAELLLRIEGYYKERLRREWHDLPDKPLESQLLDVLIGLCRGAAVERRRRIAREEEERHRHEAERQRWILDQKRAKVDEHLKEVLAEADAWIRAARIRDYANATIKALQDLEGEQAADDREWAQWALSAADAIDPLTDGPDVFQLCELLPKSANEDGRFSFY